MIQQLDILHAAQSLARERRFATTAEFASTLYSDTVEVRRELTVACQADLLRRRREPGAGALCYELTEAGERVLQDKPGRDSARPELLELKG